MEVNQDNKNKQIEENNCKEKISIHNQQDERKQFIDYRGINEKMRLIGVFDRLKKELENEENDTISEAIFQIEDEYRRKMKEDIKKCSCFFIFMFLVVFSLFSICYLVGFFIIVPINNLIFNLFFSALKCRLEIKCNKTEFNERKNFFNYLFSESRKDSINIDLVMFWSFIGLKILDTCKFRKSSMLFLVLNIIMACFIYIFDYRTSEENYSFVRIILLLIIYVLISFTVGSSSLISQQTLINIYSNLNLNLFICTDSNKEEKVNNSGEVRGYQHSESFNDLKFKNEANDNINNINTNINEINDINNKKEININCKNENNIIIENISNTENHHIEKIESNKDLKILEENNNISCKNIKSNYIKKSSIQDKNAKNKRDKAEVSFWLIFLTTLIGYLGKYYFYMLLVFLFKDSKDNNISSIILDDIYTNNTINNIIINQNDYTKTFEMKINEKYLFLIIYGFYVLCIILSIIFYYIFKCCIFEENKNYNQTKVSDIWKTFFKIFNCHFYIEKTKVESKKKIGCCKLCCETFKNYCDNECTNWIKYFFCEDFKCCSCCCVYNEDDYDKETQLFCYCYQEKGYCEWLDKFITNETQKEIIPSIILYFISRLVSLGIEQDFNDKNEDLNINQNKFILLFLLYFLIYLIINTVLWILKNRLLLLLKNNFSICYKKIYKLVLSETFIVLVSTSINGFISSIGYFQDSGKSNKTYNSNNLYSSIIFNKLFFFSFNYYCTNVSENIGKNELLLSQSTLITIYIFIEDLIIFLIKHLASKNLRTLYLIQLVFSSIIGVFIGVICFLCILFYLLFCLKSLELYTCHEGYCLLECCCCNKNSLKCKSCYSQYCEYYWSFCECPKLLTKWFRIDTNYN